MRPHFATASGFDIANCDIKLAYRISFKIAIRDLKDPCLTT